MAAKFEIFPLFSEKLSASADIFAAHDWLKKRLPVIKMEYEPQNIYNAHEFSFFWRSLPTFGDKKTSDLKILKERMSGLVCTNMDGSDKLKLLIIGESRQQ